LSLEFGGNLLVMDEGVKVASALIGDRGPSAGGFCQPQGVDAQQDLAASRLGRCRVTAHSASA